MNEPSVATNGSVVVYTYNHYAAVSSDAGASFRYIDPYTTFPSTSTTFPSTNTFCCDQRVIYEQTRDLFVWVLQYGPRSQTGFERIAVATPTNVAANRWTYWDFDAGDFSEGYSGFKIDFPNIASSSNYLYLTANFLPVGESRTTASGIIRLSLDHLAQKTALNYLRHTDVGSTITPAQGANTTMYFAQTHSTNLLRLYSWPESGTLTTTLILHTSFPQPFTACPGPDGRDMCGLSDSRVLVGWVGAGVIGFAWNAGAGGVFARPYPYIQMIRISEATKTAADEPAIWSDQVTYAYPGASLNARGHLGVVVSFSSRTRHPSTAVLIRDDISGPTDWSLLTLREGTSGPTLGRWGDYQTVVRASPTANTWVAGSFTLHGTVVDTRFVWFGRERDGPNAATVSPAPAPKRTPTPGASPTPTQPTASAQARSLLPSASEVGSGFVPTDQDFSLAERATGVTNPLAPYRSGAEMLTAWGWQASSQRDLFKTGTTSGVYEVVTVATIYGSTSGAASAYSYNLTVIAASTGTPYTTSSIGVAIGDQSAGYTRDRAVPSTTGGDVPISEMLIVFRAGRVSNAVYVYAHRAQVDTALAVRLAQLQASRSTALGTAPASPSPTASTPTVRSLSLSATAQAIAPGSTLTVRATITGVAPSTGLSVTFVIDSAAEPHPDLTLTSTTDGSGVATATYSRPSPGSDTITAFLTAEPAVRASLRVAWSSPAAARTVYLPNITKTLGGASGWQTPFIVQNIGLATTDLEISFYGFADGALLAQRRVTALRPGTSFAHSPNDDSSLPGNSQFAVVVRSAASDIVAVVNQHQGTGSRAEALSYLGLNSGSATLHLPYVAKQAGGWLTAFIVQNLGTGTANATIAFYAYDGRSAVTLTRAIAPGRSAVVDPSVEPALAAGTEYAVRVIADQPLAAVVNAHNDAASVTAPRAFSYNAVSASGPAVYLPYGPRNADGIGRTARLLIQNAGTSEAAPTLKFERVGGGGTVAITLPSVRPGSSISFDPTRSPSDSTCPVAGGPSCIGEGEHSLVVSGGQFAVLAAVLSPATAMGYTGTATLATKIHLPNVTRSLGGVGGWTTPIVLQSAGATAATVQWYSFSDGRLVHTQRLLGLASGASVRVDPRSVHELADDGSYAVVVEASDGPLVGIVIELASGADNAMIYEGLGVGTATTAPIPTPTPSPVPTASPSPTPAPTPQPTPTPSPVTAQCTPTGITTSPIIRTSQIGTTHTQTATVECEAPAGSSTRPKSVGTQVTFVVDAPVGSSNSDLTLTATTDANGVASVTWTRSNPDIDSISVYPTSFPAVRATATTLWSAGAVNTPAPAPTPRPSAGGGLTIWDIDGLARLIGSDGSYLGIVSSSKYLSDSICNEYGLYGSPYGFRSVRNEYGLYGSPYGLDSAYNPYTSTPPAIVYLGRIVGYLTKNRYLASAIDPDYLFWSYDCVY